MVLGGGVWDGEDELGNGSLVGGLVGDGWGWGLIDFMLVFGVVGNRVGIISAGWEMKLGTAAG